MDSPISQPYSPMNSKVWPHNKISPTQRIKFLYILPSLSAAFEHWNIGAPEHWTIGTKEQVNRKKDIDIHWHLASALISEAFAKCGKFWKADFSTRKLNPKTCPAHWTRNLKPDLNSFDKRIHRIGGVKHIWKSTVEKSQSHPHHCIELPEGRTFDLMQK